MIVNPFKLLRRRKAGTTSTPAPASAGVGTMTLNSPTITTTTSSPLKVNPYLNPELTPYLKPEVIDNNVNKDVYKSSGGSSGGSSQPQSTLATPTPSASGVVADKTQEYAQQQQAIYQAKLQAEVQAKAQRISNWNALPENIKREQTSGIYNKYNQEFKNKVRSYAENVAMEERRKNATPSKQLGGVYLTPAEASKYPTITKTSGTESINDIFMQSGITGAEKILGIPEGTSGVSYIPTENLKPLSVKQNIQRNIQERKERFIENKPVLSSFIFGLPTTEEEKLTSFVVPFPFTPVQTSGYIYAVTNRVSKSGGLIATGGGFITNTGKVGRVIAISRVVNTKGDVSILQTTSRGVYISKSLIKNSYKVKNPFLSKGYSVSKSSENVITQLSLGKTASTKTRVKSFLSYTKGLQKGDYVSALGVTKVSGNANKIYSGGLIKTIKTAEEGGIKFIKFTGKGGRKLNYPITQQTQQNIASVVQGSIASTLPTDNTIKAIGITATGLLTRGTATKTTSLPTTITTTRQLATTFNTQNLIQTPFIQTKTKSKSNTKQTEIARQQNIQQNIQIPIVVQKNIQEQKPQQKYIQKQINIFYPVTSIPTIFIPQKTFKPFPAFKLPKRESKPKQSKGFFSVYIRRFGKFKLLGTTTSSAQAFNIGREKVSTTLGATFTIKGASGYKTPSGFYTKQSKEGTLFIEKSKFRLSTNPEVKEIQYFKKMKGGLI